MSFLGRKSSTSQSAGTDSDANDAGAGAGSKSKNGALDSSGSPLGRFSQRAPERNTIVGIVFGAIIGLVVAYVIFPAVLTGAAPRHMSQSAIDQWVRMIAVGHAEDLHYDDANSLLALEQVPGPKAVIARLERNAQISASERDAISELKNLDGYIGLVGASAPADPGVVGSSFQILLSLVVVALAVPAAVIAWRSVVPGSAVGASSRRKGSLDAAANAKHSSQVARTKPRTSPATRPSPNWPEEETERSGVIHPQYGVPVLHTVSTFAKGQNYDDSFAIELGPELGNQFLGECGISMSTKVGNELQSVEFWGFDMASQETQTKVFAAPAAVSDPALIAAVGNRVRNPAGDIIGATLGARAIVDTSAIQLQAEIKSVICNYGGGSPNSGIESLQIEILAWQKQGQRFGTATDAALPSAENPFADYSSIVVPSSGQASSPAPPPQTSGQYGSTSPASGSKAGNPPEDDEDDPFGGTGNFMPYS